MHTCVNPGEFQARVFLTEVVMLLKINTRFNLGRRFLTADGLISNIFLFLGKLFLYIRS